MGSSEVASHLAGRHEDVIRTVEDLMGHMAVGDQYSRPLVFLDLSSSSNAEGVSPVFRARRGSFNNMLARNELPNAGGGSPAFGGASSRGGFNNMLRRNELRSTISKRPARPPLLRRKAQIFEVQTDRCSTPVAC